ncbi:MAG: NAD(P)/FAD-dependent oxidoreductase, partial [Lachnospiraceae bacterium]|nr:NAD(P)/FAD-dependent oxidoreductase [Lachnospiraceae bacterium]
FAKKIRLCLNSANGQNKNPASGSEVFLGILNKKLANVIEKESRKAHPDEKPEDYAFVYTHMIKRFKVHPTDTVSFEEAQTTLGGVSTAEIDPETMESRLVKGLYFTGEIIDVSGICGGYNLQWAWASAHAASENLKKS